MSDLIEQLTFKVGELVSGASAKPQPVDPSTPWQEPRSLDAEHGPPMPYPVECLPLAIREAVETYQKYGQQPMALVACSALSAVSIACQALADVARDENLVGPCSLSFLVIAESGERKTGADRQFAKALREWEKATNEERAKDIAAAVAKKEAWQSKVDGIKKKLTRLGGSQKPEEQEQQKILEKELAELHVDRPVIPPTVDLFMEDTNMERLVEDLAYGWPATALRSDEGGLVVGSNGMNEERAMAFLAILNRLWDGNPFDQRRIQRGHIHIEGKRLTVSLMMQAVVLCKLVGVGGGAARGTGALARFLIASPESTAGTRFFKELNPNARALVVFETRLKKLLGMEQTMSGRGFYQLTPPVLRLNEAARALWIHFHDHVERTLTPCGEFNEMKDFASKCAEQAARLACLFHVFENGPVGEIGSDKLKAGAEIAWWHLGEARRALGLVGKSEALDDAKALLAWLSLQPTAVRPPDILHIGPSRLRTKARRDRALARLYDHGLARLEAYGPAHYVAVHPAHHRAATPVSLAA